MFPSQIQAVIEKVDNLRHKVDDHWQIPRDEAMVLAQIVRLKRCLSICEIGTSYGFSTVHLTAAAAEHGGHIHTFDIDPRKVAAATTHLTEAGLIRSVTFHLGDARQNVASVNPAKPYDFVFIDATKEQSFEYLDAVLPKTARAAVLVTDNTLTHADELATFIAHLRSLPGAHSCDVPVGNGFELTILGK